MFVLLLALIDIHTLFVLLFHSFLSAEYILAGSTFTLGKGLLFFFTSRDLFSLFDIIVGVLMLFLLITSLPSFISWIIGLYLTYKILLSLTVLIK